MMRFHRIILVRVAQGLQAALCHLRYLRKTSDWAGASKERKEIICDFLQRQSRRGRHSFRRRGGSVLFAGPVLLIDTFLFYCIKRGKRHLLVLLLVSSYAH